mgnify:CR=1 FL=1
MNLAALLPILELTLALVAAMVAATVFRRHALTATLSAFGFLAAFATLFTIPRAASREVAGLLVFDNLALFYLGLLFVAGLFVTAMAHGYFQRQEERPDEFYLLLLMASLGAAILVASTHFVALILGLEILTVSLYAMIAYTRAVQNSLEAGLKYLILAAGSTAFLLFGMALLYVQTGSMEYSSFAALNNSPLSILGFGMMMVGIGFKLAVVPFHIWTPDVYQGAPAPAAAFIASVSKGGMFVVLLRFFAHAGVHNRPSLMWLFIAIAVASMFAGNLLALLQTNIKRILAYSSIANLGYLLVAFIASGPLASTAAAYYLCAYFAAVIGSFGVVAYLSVAEREAEYVDDFRGLYWQRPWLSAALTVMMLSLAGIPLTAGFLAKFYILAAGGEEGRWLLLVAVIINSTIGLYYYLRVIIAMCAEKTEKVITAPALFTERLVLLSLSLVVLLLGTFPMPLLSLLTVLGLG